MASSEDRAYEIMQELDVNYVLVIFGGLTGYASDGQYCASFSPYSATMHKKESNLFESKTVSAVAGFVTRLSRVLT